MVSASCSKFKRRSTIIESFCAWWTIPFFLLPKIDDPILTIANVYAASGKSKKHFRKANLKGSQNLSKLIGMTFWIHVCFWEREMNVLFFLNGGITDYSWEPLDKLQRLGFVKLFVPFEFFGLFQPIQSWDYSTAIRGNFISVGTFCIRCIWAVFKFIDIAWQTIFTWRLSVGLGRNVWKMIN